MLFFNWKVKLPSVCRLRGHHLFLCIHVGNFSCQQILFFLHIPQQLSSIPIILLYFIWITWSFLPLLWPTANKILVIVFIFFQQTAILQHCIKLFSQIAIKMTETGIIFATFAFPILFNVLLLESSQKRNFFYWTHFKSTRI